LDLHREIEELRSKVKNGTAQMTQMEKEFTESRDYSEQEIAKLQDELSKLRDRYDRWEK
jgi:predicted  nucleic acid-binding Zn-ribbon protein